MLVVELQSVALQFNAAIDDRDLDRLTTLMTDDHRFVDTEGRADVGSSACLEQHVNLRLQVKV